MVRDSLDRTIEHNQKQDQTIEPHSWSQTSEEAVVPEQSQNSQTINAESKEPSERQLDFLLWSKLSSEEESKSWSPPLTGADANSLPTHLRTFSSAAEYQLVKRTYQQLQHSGYYWGPMTMEEAHEILTQLPQGTFLIRDSGQSDVFFTLSYQSEDKPTSVRIQLNNLLFSLCGSHRTFASLFALLAFYTSSICKLTEPYRKQRPERLKQMCRRALVCTHGAENATSMPGLSPQLKAYVCAYPHSL
ncbi:suppressor of cytokine signaling 1-like [Nothobranchius furzeri]|uniref:Suppressor of cytokine signaling 1b n=2 Tax=Nothobranchius TaxID=28779 RepID=A0A1A8V7N0_NOTFU|nr:suppressor of cytokine signaling 1 [Nothobranchius furzeri]XP_015830696.1 suppressor of cytokine signaling 1 [Nothobranchius furzeri]XP_054593712.1 suppressor of cytokine signaling 1 [Nothobranchius furzeri]KAF7225301.1 transcript variant X2 [Nothobranchius furzeri]KAF7225302.1 transcript variant X1 [Nothobranchius furzeri]